MPAVFFLLLVLFPSGSLFAQAGPSVSLGTTQEDYSFTNAGVLSWAEGRVPSGPWTVMVRADRARRFGKSDLEGAAGLAWKGKGRGGAVWLGGTPDADVLPRGYAEASYARALAQGLYLEASAKASDYVPAHVYGASLAAFWQVKPKLELIGRVGSTLTKFRAGADKTYPAFLVKARLGSTEAGPWLGGTCGWYKEAFEAGAPGATGAFAANVYAAEAGTRISKSLSLRGGFEYEDRDNGTVVRRWTLAAGWDF